MTRRDAGFAAADVRVLGPAIDQDDVRAHGKDERVRVTSYDEGVDFTYRFFKALTK